MSVKEVKKIVVKYRGEEVPKKDLNYISNNYILTRHAKEMIDKRHSNVNVVESIRTPMIAYFNTDGSINCAINEDEYFVIATDAFPFRVVTFKEKSWYGKNVLEKREMAMNGYDRKYI